MKIKFLRSRGYKVGQVVELENSRQAQLLIDEGVAVRVDDEPEPQIAEPAATSELPTEPLLTDQDVE